MLIESKSEPTLAADAWMLYLYAMRSPATKEKYLMRLGKLLVFALVAQRNALIYCITTHF